MIKSFIITLKRNLVRHQGIEKFFKRANFNYEYYYGVDGKNEDVNSYNISRKKVQRFWHNKLVCCSYSMNLSDSEYACALSHIHLYEKIIKEKIPFTVIFEDDAYPVSIEATKFVNNIEEVYKDTHFDILFLVHDDKLKYSTKEKFDVNGITIKKVGYRSLDWLLNRRRVVYLCGCYILTIEGAKKLLEKAYPVRMPADTLTGLIAYNKLNAWKVEQPLIKLLDTPSTLVRYKKKRPWWRITMHDIKRKLKMRSNVINR